MNDDRVLRIAKGDQLLYVADHSHDPESDGLLELTTEKRRAFRVSAELAKRLQAFYTAQGHRVTLEFADDDYPAPQTNFKYYMVMVDGEARGLFVLNHGGKRLDMIVWNHHSKTWEHDPAYVSRYFISDLDAEEISRAKAEEIAHGFGSTVPSESEFMKISDLAERKLKSRQE